MQPIYVKRVAAYAPGLETAEDWASWAKGERELLREAPSPKVSFVPMLTRRRLSALSKMVVLVNHQVSVPDETFLQKKLSHPSATEIHAPAAEALPPAKITFASEFGEIAQQLKISQTFLDAGTVSPAHFSLSVFNASVASASILEKNEAGYSAVFSGKAAFSTGLKDCVSALLAGSEKERIFIFADELIPETYAPIAGIAYPNAPCALAIRISLDSQDALGELDLSFFSKGDDYESASEEALAFIKADLVKWF